MDELQLTNYVENIFKEFNEAEEYSEDENFKILTSLSEQQIEMLIESSKNYLLDNLLWNDSYYYLQYLLLIENSRLIEVQEKSIDEAVIWIKNNFDKNIYAKYLGLVNKYGTNRQVVQALDKTLNYLTRNPDNAIILCQYLTLVENCGTNRQIQKAIEKSLIWLMNISQQASYAWQKYLVIIEKHASFEVRNYVIMKVNEWLELNTENSQVRQKYISLVDKKGTLAQKAAVIIQTEYWLEQHTEDKDVRKQYFSLIENYGTPHQKQTFIEKILIWLQHHIDDTEIRRHFFIFIKNNLQYLQNPYQIFNQEIDLLQKKETHSPSSLWISFLITFHIFIKHNYFPGYKIKDVVSLALRQYPDDYIIINLVFSNFRNYLDHEVAFNLANYISNIPLEKMARNQQQNIILSGNFFRDYGDFSKAKQCYSKILFELLPIHIEELEPTEKTRNQILDIIKTKAKKNATLIQLYTKNIDSVYLGYGYLLLLEPHPNLNKAIQYFEMVLANKPEHSFALWQLALSYEKKGKDFFDKAIEFYSKAILYDRQGTGRLTYEFGRFYFHCINNLEKAREYFEISIQQKVNLPVCISMSELETQADNLKMAREFLKKGLALVPETRIDIEQREQFQSRIQTLVERLISPEAITSNVILSNASANL